MPAVVLAARTKGLDSQPDGRRQGTLLKSRTLHSKHRMSYGDESEAASYASSQQQPDDQELAPTSLKRARMSGDGCGSDSGSLPQWHQRLEAWQVEAAGVMLERPDLFPPEAPLPSIEFSSPTLWTINVGGAPKLRVALSASAEYRHLAVQRVSLMYDAVWLEPGVMAVAEAAAAAANAAAVAAAVAAALLAAAAETAAGPASRPAPPSQAGGAALPPPPLASAAGSLACVRQRDHVAEALALINDLSSSAIAPEAAGDVARTALLVT